MRRLSLALGLIVTVAGSASAQAYDPFGVQHDVAVSTVLGGGWTQCYVAFMGAPIGDSAENILNECDGTKVMMAGRAVGSSTLTLLAEGPLAQITQNTGGGTSNHHTVNGAEWYFASGWSWGFADGGDNVQLSSCDTEFGQDSSDRMCLHTLSNTGGYRIGNDSGLNSDFSNFEKVFYETDGTQAAPEPASLVLIGTGLLGIAGFARSRKRNA